MQRLRPRILCFNAVQHALQDLESLREIADVEVISSKSRQELFCDFNDKYKDIDAIYRTSASGLVEFSHLVPEVT